MQKNLNKIIFPLLAIETLVWIILMNFDNESNFGFPMLFATIIINIIATILLFIYKPKFYLLTAIISLSFFLIPILTLAMYIASGGC